MKRLLLPLALLGLVACEQPEAASTSDTPAPEALASYDANAIPVRSQPAAQGAVVRTLELGGVAEAWRAARLAPSAQGVVETLNVQLGDTVTRGQLLAAVDTTTLKLQHQAAQRAVDLARLQLTDAESEASRAKGLAESGAITPRDGDKAALGLDLARAQLDQAEAQAAALAGQMKLAQVHAPFAGRVTALHVEQGEFFSGMGGMGGPPMLVEVQALETIKVDVNLPEIDLSRVREGMKVELISDAFVGRTFEGVVSLVNAAATPGARTFLVRIKCDNSDGTLRPGMFLRARVVVEKRDDVVYVPERAVTRHGGGHYVMLLEGDTAKRRPVTPGLRGDQGWQIEGVQAGEQVVIEGHFGLPDGATVRVIGSESGA